MAKISIKSEKLTLFGGIIHVRELFSRFIIANYLSEFYPNTSQDDALLASAKFCESAHCRTASLNAKE